MTKINENNIPLVTIGILSFNRLNDLKETIIRLKDITYKNLEIIIVDNGSTDGSQEFIQGLLDFRIKCFILEKNLGVGYGRLKILQESKGDFIFSIDEDCYLKFDIIEQTVNIFIRNPNLGAIGFDNINPSFFSDKNLYYRKTKFINNYIDSKIKFEGALSLCSSAWRKTVLEKIQIKNIHIQKLNLLVKDINLKKNFRKILLSTEIEADLSYLMCSYGFNSFISSDLIAFHKISPSNRHQKFLIMDGILRCFRMTINYSPNRYILKELYLLIYKCINTFLNTGKFIYINSILITLFSKSNNLFKFKRINKLNYKNLRKINIEPILGIDSNFFET